MTSPHIVALGGTTRANSATNRTLAAALAVAEASGARTTLLCGTAIDFPNYDPSGIADDARLEAFLAALRGADGVILGSPGYHGTFSGLVKNALDYIEGLRADPRPYLDGRPVGCVVTAAGWQGAVSTLTALRSIVHALFPLRREGGDDPKFPALYDQCRSNPRRLVPMLNRAGFRDVHIQPFWGHGYFERLPGLRQVDHVFNALAAKTGWRFVTTYAYVVVRKERD